LKSNRHFFWNINTKQQWSKSIFTAIKYNMRSSRAFWESQLNRPRSVTVILFQITIFVQTKRFVRTHAHSSSSYSSFSNEKQISLVIIFTRPLPHLHHSIAVDGCTNAVCLWYISIVVFFFSTSIELSSM